MKKRLISLLLACVMLLAVMGLAACKDKDDTDEPEGPVKLSAPTVTLTDNTASWASDANADKFEISIDGNLSYVENTVTAKVLTNGQVFKIRAVGDGVRYSTSDWSNSVTYEYNAGTPDPVLTKLGTPSVTISSTGLASWSSENASSYVYRINGGAEVPTSAGSVQLSDGQSISVKAIGDGVSYTDSDYSTAKTYTASVTPGTPSDTEAPTYLGITASSEKPVAGTRPPILERSYANSSRYTDISHILGNYYTDISNALSEPTPEISQYAAYSSAGNTVYVQIWLDNPNQNTILSLKLNGVKYQTGIALQSFFMADGSSYLNCVYVAVTVPASSYGEISYTVTEIEYVEGANVSQDGKEVMIGTNDTVKVGLTYESYPSASCTAAEAGCHTANATVSVTDLSALAANRGYWIRAALISDGSVAAQKILSPGASQQISFTGLSENTEYTLVIFYYGDNNEGRGLTFNVLHTQVFTTDEVVTVDEFLLGGELVSADGKNGAKITFFAFTAYDAKAEFDRVEIYNGSTLVLTDSEFDGAGEYYGLNSKTEYTVKLYYSSETNGYTGRVKEITVTTPAYTLPDVNGYGSDKNVTVGKHAIYGFEVEKYTELKHYDIIVRGYVQDDAYFAPLIVEMLDDPGLLNRLEQQAYENYARPGGYIWEAAYYQDLFTLYWMAWDHKECSDYSDGEWREIAETSERYVYELTLENDGLFIANDGAYVYNYYAVLRDYFDYEDLRFEIFMRFDLGDGKGEREIIVDHASPYFDDVNDGDYSFNIEADESVKNGYVFTETYGDYKALYVYKLALYKDGEFVCYVPFTSGDVTSVDMDAWLNEWIEKLKCEIPDATVQQMIEKLGAEAIREMLDSLDFYEELGDVVVDSAAGEMNGSTSGRLGNEKERELLRALAEFDSDVLLSLFKESTGENKTLDAFIADSKNSTIIAVLNSYRNTVEITDSNAEDIYLAIDGVYGVYSELKSAYESAVRLEYSEREIADRIESIEKISFKFVIGTDLAPAGSYKLYVLYRSLLKDYEGDESEESYERYVDIKRDLDAPENIRVDGRTLLWDEVEGANGYYIYVNGEERWSVGESRFDNYGEITDGDKIQIKAHGNYAYDSEFSEEYTFTREKLSTPAATVSGRNVSWEHVEGATKYVCEINGSEYETSDNSLYVYQSGTVRIKAVDESGVYADSDWKSVTVTASGSDKK